MDRRRYGGARQDGGGRRGHGRADAQPVRRWQAPPLAEQLRAIASEQGLDANGQEAAASLGTPFRVYANDVSEFRRRLALEVTAFNTARGLPGDTWYQCKPAPTSVPKSPRPCSAKSSTATPPPMRASSLQRSPSTLGPPGPTLSRASTSRSPPVKSVSTLWALADKPTAARIEHAHQAAVRDALSYLERNALYTRQGTNGVRQVETRGLIAAAFTHRDSRAGDPRSAHPRGDRQQGPDAGRRTLARDRRPDPLRGHRGRLGDVQHCARAAPGRPPWSAIRRSSDY